MRYVRQRHMTVQTGKFIVTTLQLQIISLSGKISENGIIVMRPTKTAVDV